MLEGTQKEWGQPCCRQGQRVRDRLPRGWGIAQQNGGLGPGKFSVQKEENEQAEACEVVPLRGHPLRGLCAMKLEAKDRQV